MHRPQSHTLAKVVQMFDCFGVDLRARLNRAKTVEQAQEFFQTAKGDVAKRYKALAMVMHPDRGNGHEEEFKEVTALWNIIKKLEATIRPIKVTVPVAPVSIYRQGPVTVVHVSTFYPSTGTSR